MKYLITGVTKGFGKFVYEELGGFGLTRKNKSQLSEIKKADTIIHCAYDKRETISLEELPEYLDSSIFLTRELLQVPHRKFVFLSTVNVYPPSSKIHQEDEKIDINKVSTIYGITKLMCESMIEKTNHLILRCPNFLGKYSNNNLTKLINDEVLSLSKDSGLNLVLYEDVINFIKEDKSGIYNVASSKNIRFSEIARILNKTPQFGNYNYQVGKIDNDKCGFDKTSEEVFLDFISRQ